jgi:hypothetical protein
MKQDKRQYQVDSLFVKGDSFSRKSLTIVNNPKMQTLLGHQRTSLNYNQEVEGIAFEDENE